LSGILEKVNNLNGVRFDIVKDTDVVEGKGKYIGFIAQELEKEFPEFVVTYENGYKAVAYGSLTPVLVEAIKELKKEKDILKIDIETLKTQNIELENRIKTLEEKMSSTK